MWTEILNIKPKVVEGDLSKMERSLSTRFSNVAKKFGKGLVAAITGGGVTALALGVINKILNPLKETQEAIDNLLGRTSEISSLAKHFGTSTGNLFKLEQIGKSTGLSSQDLHVMMEKFQEKVIETKADPTKASSVRAFMSSPDMAENFFNFMGSQRKLTPDQQRFVQTDVFGAKLQLKSAEFAQTDLAARAAKLGLQHSSLYSTAIDRANIAAEHDQILETNRDTMQFIGGTGVLGNENGKGVANGVRFADKKNAIESQQILKQTENLGKYDALARLQLRADAASIKMEQAFTTIIKHLPAIADGIEKYTKSRVGKGIEKDKGE